MQWNPNAGYAMLRVVVRIAEEMFEEVTTSSNHFWKESYFDRGNSDMIPARLFKVTPPLSLKVRPRNQPRHCITQFNLRSPQRNFFSDVANKSYTVHASPVLPIPQYIPSPLQKLPHKANPVYNEYLASPKAWFVITRLQCTYREKMCRAGKKE